MTRMPRKAGQSLRSFPTYTIPEAASYLAIPTRTLRYWILDHPVWPVAGADQDTPLLSFQDLAQAYYVEIVRKHFRFSLPTTRRVLEAAKKETKSPYPLLRPNIYVFFKHVMMEKPARGRQPHRMINLTQNRQLAIPDIVRPFSTRIRWDAHGEPIQLFPWRLWTPGDQAKPVSIHPDIMSGRLVITGTRIPVVVVLQRKLAGETVADLAIDYHLPEGSIQEALTHLVQQAA